MDESEGQNKIINSNTHYFWFYLNLKHAHALEIKSWLWC